MTRKSMKGKLGASLKAEEVSVNERFRRAETELARKSATESEAESSTKVIRDSFTMPISDRELLTSIKQRCMRSGIDTNKSEILRAGLAALDSMSDSELATVFEGLTKVKTGRPQQAA
jgi:hypothetical protein